MTETSGREKVLEEALRDLLELCISQGNFCNGVTDSSGTIDEGEVKARDYFDQARAALASPSTQEPALQGIKVEEIAKRFAWQNMASAPRNGSPILIRHKHTYGNPIEVYRHSAGSDVYPYKTWEPEIGRTASIRGAIFPSEEDNFDWAPLDPTERIAAAIRTYAGEGIK